MSVSEKMAHSAYIGLLIASGTEKTQNIMEEGCGEVQAQAVVNAAYFPFDLEDEDTWPEWEHAPSGRPWILISDEGDIGFGHWNKDAPRSWVRVVKYADSQVFIPREIEE